VGSTELDRYECSLTLLRASLSPEEQLPQQPSVWYLWREVLQGEQHIIISIIINISISSNSNSNSTYVGGMGVATGQALTLPLSPQHSLWPSSFPDTRPGCLHVAESTTHECAAYL